MQICSTLLQNFIFLKWYEPFFLSMQFNAINNCLVEATIPYNGPVSYDDSIS